MDFILWATRSLHVFSIVVWLGGLTYQAVVVLPHHAERHTLGARQLQQLRRFIPFIWMCNWTLLVTGVGLMLFSPRFIFFEFKDTWSIVLGLKQVTFLVMMYFSFGYARMVTRLIEEEEKEVRNHELLSLLQFRVGQFSTTLIVLGIVAIMLAAGLT